MRRCNREKEGIVVSNEQLKLNNVLYVPNLICNLISVSLLIEESNCIVWLTNNFFFIQDRSLRMLIGAGEQNKGHYYFQGMVSAKDMKAVGRSTTEFWHQKVGISFRESNLVVPSC